MRQWVCSLPWRLRVVCGYDSELCADVFKAFEKQVSRSLRHRAKQSLGLASVEQAHTGSVLFIQVKIPIRSAVPMTAGGATLRP